MIVFAAIDLRDSNVVQLVGGDPADERIRWRDPVAVAQRWVSSGFEQLHIVDLDAALGTGNNRAIIGDTIRAVPVPVQVGGGVRTDEIADELFKAGAARVIVGTRAVREPEWLEQLAARYAERIVLAADVRERNVVIHGWTAGAGTTIDALLARVAATPLAAVLVTDVGREGSLSGIDAPLFTDIVSATSLPVFAAGGIGDSSDLQTLKQIGAAGAVLGMALYTGRIDPAQLPTK